MRKYGAGHGIRTRDIQLGKLASNSSSIGNSDVSTCPMLPKRALTGPSLDITGWEKGWETRRPRKTLWFPVLFALALLGCEEQRITNCGWACERARSHMVSYSEKDGCRCEGACADGGAR
jgi:hypothetical protein